MSPALTAKYQTFISAMSKQENIPEDHNSGRQMLTFEDVPHTYPLTTATEIIELSPEEIILPIADDPIDFIIELGNECEDLQYQEEKTNEAYGTAYTEDDVQAIINEFIEAIQE